MIKNALFQCPTSGFLLFYAPDHTLECNARVFQCPTSGFLLFYKWRDFDSRHKEKSFQCPTSGFLLFYVAGNGGNYADRQCFNALPRAFFFSTQAAKMAEKEAIEFQCPTSGFLLFYKFAILKNDFIIFCFNALPRAFFFSTLRLKPCT